MHKLASAANKLATAILCTNWQIHFIQTRFSFRINRRFKNNTMKTIETEPFTYRTEIISYLDKKNLSIYTYIHGRLFFSGDKFASAEIILLTSFVCMGNWMSFEQNEFANKHDMQLISKSDVTPMHSVYGKR
jgi:hypothetical protein